MPDPHDKSLSFAAIHTETSRLVRCTEPPEVETLNPGDMVICEETWDSDDFVEECAKKGVHVRVGRYRFETEKVFNRRSRRTVAPDYPEAFRAGRPFMAPPSESFDPKVVEASTAAFAKAWDALSSELSTGPTYVSARGRIPDDWIDFLPYPTLNPAQEEALPFILGERSAMVVAPTGAGKTMIGMLASLNEIKARGGKAAWLVPQRSLTSELDRELELWRKKGLKVVALSGETTTDAKQAREADLWVATTEKFEALCRASSMKETIASIGTLVVDEIHLLGEPGRGPLLEALLARVKGDESPVRLVGLSATASNAKEVSEWLGADLVEITWRPTRLTNQIITLPMGDRSQEAKSRNSMTSAIVRDVTLDGGSVLVFCGPKANVRSVAVEIARSRGVDVSRVSLDDAGSVAEVCDEAGVGLHYSDWPHKKRAEKDFRERTTNVLVATSTLAAGVNTPARAVVVRDTSIGPTPMEVSMIQQMFGRAGRAGQESEGWSFVLTTANETARIRQMLDDGYTIRSGILQGVEDHVLGEIVQGHIKSMAEAEKWWEGTLAHFQGEHSLRQLHEAMTFLSKWRFIELEEAAQAQQLVKVTPLGALTSKMMVDTRDAASLMLQLSKLPTPTHHLAAEKALIEAVAHNVSSFAKSPDAPQDQTPDLMRLMDAEGDVTSLRGRPNVSRKDSNVRMRGENVIKVGMLVAARSPHALASGAPRVAGVNRALFNPAIYDAPRYLAWIAALGPLGIVPAWSCVVAADLGARITHYRLTPTRGSGRLLRVCEKASGGVTGGKMKSMWEKVVSSGCSDPSMLPSTGSGAGAISLRPEAGGVRVSPGATVFTSASGEGRWQKAKVSAGKATTSGVTAAFGQKGDWDGTGWLRKFSSATP